MLGLILKKKSQTTLEETVAFVQKGDVTLRNELISSFKPFIAKTVSATCKRYIYESDDEYSIGLIAFNEAIDKYQPEKGKSLLRFAEVIIKRKVIDYIRKNAKETSVRLDFEVDKNAKASKGGTSLETELSLDYYQKKEDELKRKDEILLLHQKLTEFKITFQEIVEESPKHQDARKNAIAIAKLINERPRLSQYLLEKKRLPIKELEEIVAVSRKTIERNRKYIIAMCIIFAGEFHYLSHYLKGV